MADPKLMRIMQVFADRLATIRTADGFHTDIGRTVERYPRVFNEEEAPACSVALDSSDQSQVGSVANGVKTDPGLVIRASSTFEGVAEDVAIKMLTDIHVAVEILSSTIPQQPDLFRRANESGWQIIYPENLDRVVSIEVLYSFSYSRIYGED